MNLINRDTDYAIRALRHMARRPDRVLSVAALYPILGVPRPYLRRILQTLARRGVLRSSRGKGGGFVLNRAPAQTYLTEIIRIFQGQVDFARCVLRGKLCPHRATCPLRRTIKEIEALALQKLRGVTIQCLL